VIDEYTRECLAIDAAGSIRSGRVIELLAKLVSLRGAPKCAETMNLWWAFLGNLIAGLDGEKPVGGPVTSPVLPGCG
jgi:hypothetical protein